MKNSVMITQQFDIVKQFMITFSLSKPFPDKNEVSLHHRNLHVFHFWLTMVRAISSFIISLVPP